MPVQIFNAPRQEPNLPVVVLTAELHNEEVVIDLISKAENWVRVEEGNEPSRIGGRLELPTTSELTTRR